MNLHTCQGQKINLDGWYAGRPLFLVLSGPSLQTLKLETLGQRGVITMGVNNSWAAYRPNLWIGIDHAGRFLDLGWKDPGIIKFYPQSRKDNRLRVKIDDNNFRDSQFTVQQMPGVYLFEEHSDFFPETFLSEPTVSSGVPGWKDKARGGCSVLMGAIKVAYSLGFRTIYLVGCDFHMENGKQNYAFKQSRTERAVDNNQRLYQQTSKNFQMLLPYFETAGLKVYNCNPDSKLTVFPHMPFDKAVEEVSADCRKPIDTEHWYTIAINDVRKSGKPKKRTQ